MLEVDEPRGLDRPLFLLYNGIIMKEENPIKYRVKSSHEVFYTFKHWPSKEIDGVEFLGVVKKMPSHQLTQTVHWMRKDSLEHVK